MHNLKKNLSHRHPLEFINIRPLKKPIIFFFFFFVMQTRQTSDLFYKNNCLNQVRQKERSINKIQEIIEIK